MSLPPIEPYLSSLEVSAHLLCPSPPTSLTPRSLASAFVYAIAFGTDARHARNHAFASTAAAPHRMDVEDLLAVTGVTSDNFALGFVFGLGQPHVFTRTPLMSDAKPLCRRFAVNLDSTSALEFLEFVHFDNGMVCVNFRRFLHVPDGSLPCINLVTLHAATPPSTRRSGCGLAALGAVVMRAEIVEAISCPVCCASHFACSCPFLAKSKVMATRVRTASWTHFSAQFRRKAHIGKIRMRMTAIVPDLGEVPVMVADIDALNVVLQGDSDYMYSARKKAVQLGFAGVAVAPDTDRLLFGEQAERQNFINIHKAYVAEIGGRCAAQDVFGLLGVQEDDYFGHVEAVRPIEEYCENEADDVTVLDVAQQSSQSSHDLNFLLDTMLDKCAANAPVTRCAPGHVAPTLTAGTAGTDMSAATTSETSPYFPLPVSGEDDFAVAALFSGVTAPPAGFSIGSVLPSVVHSPPRLLQTKESQLAAETQLASLLGTEDGLRAQAGGQFARLAEGNFTAPVHRIPRPSFGDRFSPDSVAQMPFVDFDGLGLGGMGGAFLGTINSGGGSKSIDSRSEVHSSGGESSNGISASAVDGNPGVSTKGKSIRKRRRTTPSDDAERKHACSRCSARFKMRGDMQRHQRLVHDKAKNFVCDTCGKAFGHSGHLNRHKQSHRGERRFKCELCGFDFLQKSHLLSHMKHIHSDPSEGEHGCSLCKLPMASVEELRGHLRSFHSVVGIRSPQPASHPLVAQDLT